MTCGILSRGFAQMNGDACRRRHLVEFSCKDRGFCSCCMGWRMNEGAANFVDHVLPEGVPLRQWVLILPHPLRYPLAFDPKNLGLVLAIRRLEVAGGGKRMPMPKGASSSLPLRPRATL
ncbi:MAG: transposase zinc-binding domain-containing protein [Fibrobacteria bacterium]